MRGSQGRILCHAKGFGQFGKEAGGGDCVCAGMGDRSEEEYVKYGVARAVQSCIISKAPNTDIFSKVA